MNGVRRLNLLTLLRRQQLNYYVRFHYHRHWFSIDQDWLHHRHRYLWLYLELVRLL